MAMRKMKSAMKARKSMRKMKKAKKSMRRMKKAKRVSIIGRKWQVFAGTKLKTVGGLKKADLMKNKQGKIVSRRKCASSRKNKKIAAWGIAFKAARRALGVRGFCPCGGKTASGQALLKKTRSLYRK